MLQKVILQCRCNTEQRPTYNWGSLFHGVLVSLLPPETAEILHQCRMRPYSQYVTAEKDNSLTWHIGIWDEEAADAITAVVLPLKNFVLEHNNTSIEVVAVRTERESWRDFFTRHFSQEEVCRRYEIYFLTPCTHKRDGRYVIFPEIKLMVNSLVQRYSSFAQDFSLDDSEALEQIIDHLNIVRYSLRSAVYHLEGVKITGFAGKIIIQIQGPEQLARLAGLLLSFAEYAGIGGKTALGMGGVKVVPVPPKEQNTLA
ncbi:MAG: CRISPR-associated endoribonuclease Cas6 [Peptococcaceae bacterium]|nr:CRISPR-associated endoribonuclease Cas6 [Peptococcaceae bacterium]NMA14364.1 CRISPR-associated endoribonuclease Cas6 [Clostridia bacterium]